MKCKATCILVAMALLAAVGCTGEKKTDDKAAGQADEVKPVNASPEVREVRGTVGDGTSMNVVEVVTADGDTVYVTTPAQMVAGGVSAGDVVDIIYNEKNDENVGSIAVNISALAQLWTMESVHGQSQSIELCENGTANTWNMGTVEYDSWKLEGGLLLLHSPAQIAKEMPEYTDTFHIMKLTSEQLVLSAHGIEYEFGR